MVFETLKVYSDKISQRAVTNFVRLAAKNDNFAKHLTAAIVKQTANVKALPRHELYPMLAWTSIAIDSLNAESAKKAISKLVEIQAALLEAVLPTPVPWKVSTWECMQQHHMGACAACEAPHGAACPASHGALCMKPGAPLMHDMECTLVCTVSWLAASMLHGSPACWESKHSLQYPCVAA